MASVKAVYMYLRVNEIVCDENCIDSIEYPSRILKQLSNGGIDW